ncbi:hypothetical protein Cylst_2626 [Cylindrospermum stagnale PCC 7417]|uniref:Uncharacterized protein n=1 Tax=Cylindrospermum stagnale PCC 7417 TaxID=56107 RepID=K9WWS6_9NOST|nr:hypothetical protein [Cylindrospermum stagnale]AFZ24830.1 hypothetical protein Cylst_2626 [Cylindrospermum stagnale PCC 7417]
MKAAIIASLTLLSLTAPAFAATTNQYKFKGESASASFSQYDGCNSTYVNVYAFDNVTKEAPGAPTSQKEAYLYYSNYNYCTGVGSYGDGSSKDATFTIGNSLQSASLSGTFTLYDYSTAVNKTAAVNLSWAGTGDTFRGNSHSHYQGPGYQSKYRSVGAYRDASVTGTVYVDGINLIANLPSFGSLSSNSGGSLTITKN